MAISEKTLVLKNTGTGNITLRSITFNDPENVRHVADLSPLGGSATEGSNAVLAYNLVAGATKTFKVDYVDAGAGDGTYTGTIAIGGSNGAITTINTIVIIGTGIKTTPPPTTTTTTAVPTTTTTRAPITTTTTSGPTTTTTLAPGVTTTTQATTTTTTSGPATYSITRNKSSMINGETVTFTFTTNQSGSFNYSIDEVTRQEIGNAPLTGTISNNSTLTYTLNINPTTGFSNADGSARARQMVIYIDSITSTVGFVYGVSIMSISISAA
jgi:hypothetical protein